MIGHLDVDERDVELFAAEQRHALGARCRLGDRAPASLSSTAVSKLTDSASSSTTRREWPSAIWRDA